MPSILALETDIDSMQEIMLLKFILSLDVKNSDRSYTLSELQVYAARCILDHRQELQERLDYLTGLAESRKS